MPQSFPQLASTETGPPAKTTTKRFGAIGIYAGLAAAILLYVAASAYWVVLNVVQIGRDAGGHLVRSLEYARLDVFSEIDFSPQAVFQVLTYHNYRPPLFYWAVQPFYWLFGRTMDSAQWFNVFLLAVLLVSTFLLGRCIASGKEALFAVILLGLFPILAAMTRLFYLENFVSVMVVLCLWTLWKTDYFTNRYWSLAWGFCIGIGLLVKWTLPAYLLLPTLVALWRGWTQYRGKPVSRPSALRQGGVDAIRVLLALSAGVALAALWYVPNRTHALQLPLGDGLFVLWALLWSALLYTLATCFGLSFNRPSDEAIKQPVVASPLGNLAAGLLVAGSLASLWYAPRSDFLGEIRESALGTYGGNYKPANPFRLRNYLHPFRYLVDQHLGLLSSITILPFALLPWLWYGQQHILRRVHRRMRSLLYSPTQHQRWRGGWLLWGSAFSTYLVLSQLSQDGERNLAPLLPILALILSIGLAAYPRRWAVTIGGIGLSVLAVQWAMYTFDGLGSWQQRTASLWAQSDFLVQPASGGTDPGFWIAPDVLETVDGTADAPSSLGMLINSQSIHRSPFIYLIETEQRHITLMALTERDTSGWGAVFANQWILLKDGDNKDVEAVGQEAIARILRGDPLFHQLYREAKRYPLPNGETAYLYQRASGPAHPNALPEMVESGRRAAAFIRDNASPATTLIFGNPDQAVWTAMHGLNIDHVFVLDGQQEPAESLPPGLGGEIFAVLNSEMGALRHWLEQSSYQALEIGDDRVAVAIYGRPEQPLATMAVDATWPSLSITSLRSFASTAVGRVLPVELSLAGVREGSWKGSLRLIDPNGTVVAQSDPVLASEVKLGLFIPPQSPVGAYTLALTVYNATTLVPVRDNLGREQAPLVSIYVDNPAEP